jgi:hypothetical protein
MRLLDGSVLVRRAGPGQTCITAGTWGPDRHPRAGHGLQGRGRARRAHSLAGRYGSSWRPARGPAAVTRVPAGRLTMTASAPTAFRGPGGPRHAGRLVCPDMETSLMARCFGGIGYIAQALDERSWWIKVRPDVLRLGQNRSGQAQQGVLHKVMTPRWTIRWRTDRAYSRSG